MTTPQSLDDKRVAMVNEHMKLENAYDFPGCVGVFGRPQYQLIADGELYDGADRVHYFLSQNHTAFPDFVFEPTRVSPTTGAVLVEGRFTGTHLGPWRGLPPTGRKFEMQFAAVFVFEQDRLVCERVYFDPGKILRDLGIAHDPLSVRGRVATLANHPLTIGRALMRRVTNR